MGFEIEFVELVGGKKPFKKFIMSLSLKERAKVFETINFFQELKDRNLRHLSFMVKSS